MDTYTKPGTYYCNSASKAETLAHCPVNNSGFKLLVIRTGYENANLIQIIEVPIGLNDGGSTYRRMGNPSAWGNWVKSPTRYDIDTLNNSLPISFKKYTMATGTPLVLSIPNSFRGYLFCNDTSGSAKDGIYSIVSTATGSVTLVAVKTASDFTFDVATANRLTITIASGGAFVCLMEINGKVSEV